MQVEKENNTFGIGRPSKRNLTDNVPQAARKALGNLNKEVSALPFKATIPEKTVASNFRPFSSQIAKKEVKGTAQQVEGKKIMTSQETVKVPCIVEDEEWPDIEYCPMCSDPKTGCKECFPPKDDLSIHGWLALPSEETFAWLNGFPRKKTIVNSPADSIPDDNYQLLPIELPRVELLPVEEED